jgi:hypothetical protein
MPEARSVTKISGGNFKFRAVDNQRIDHLSHIELRSKDCQAMGSLKLVGTDRARPK